MADGYECKTNATFNGVDTSVSYAVENLGAFAETVFFQFRTKRPNGTILQISGNDGKIVRILVHQGKLLIEVPVRSGNVESTPFGPVVTDGNWHNVVVKFFDGRVSATVDSSEEILLAVDSSVVLSTFVSESVNINIGSSISFPGDQRDVYNVNNVGSVAVDIRTSSESPAISSNYFRGCLGEVRIGNVLLPFYLPEQLANSTAESKFVVRNIRNVKEECELCFQTECLNGGTCANPREVFECSCPAGFDDALCSTNIDECVNNDCKNGVCVDGVANYTCSCDRGWTGWLCDTDLDECLYQPCQNGGICSQTTIPGGYNCECPEEFEGPNCEELKIKTCANQPCKNGATCRDGKSMCFFRQ